MIDLDKLHRTWGVEFERTETDDELTALAKLARARNKAVGSEDHLPDEAYKIVVGWGKLRREALKGQA